MKVVVQILPLHASEYGPDLLRRLASIYPEGLDCSSAFSLQLPEDDPRTDQVIAELERSGVKQWLDKSRQPRRPLEYSLKRYRTYDASDLEGSAYLKLASAEGTYFVDDLRRSETGEIRLTPRYLDRGWDLTYTSSGWMIIPDRVKRLVEGAGLRGVVFTSTLLEDDRDGPPVPAPWGTADFPEPWWELTSDRTLPPMAATVKKLGPLDALLPRDARNVVMLKDSEDPLNVGLEPHYIASELAAAEPFDLALTHERFRWGRCGILIASKRFYEFFRDNGIRASWVPVRIDPG